jgi:putative peptidoglycan lipid II flippase
VAFVLLGDVIVAAIFQTGDFERSDTIFVWLVLCGYAIGLLASTATRLFSSAFFALHDTRTPARIAVVRVVVAAALGGGLMVLLRGVSVEGRSLGAVGLAVGGGAAAWVEWYLLRRDLRARLGSAGAGTGVLVRLLGAALIAALIGRAIVFVLPESLIPDSRQLRYVVTAACVLAPFGIAYFALARAFGVREAGTAVDRVLRRIRR